MRNRTYRNPIAIAATLAASHAGAQPILIDGYFDDWQSTPVTVTDATGDATGPFDITDVRVLSAGTTLYLEFDVNAEQSIQGGVGFNQQLAIVIDMPSVGRTLTVDYFFRVAYLDGNLGDTVAWDDLRYALLPTYANSHYEARIDLATFGVQAGDTVSLDFDLTDSLDAPVPITLDQPAVQPPAADTSRTPCTDFRVYSHNTLTTGLFDGPQAAPLARLIDAFDADIYCFQEEYNSNAAAIRDLLETIDPLADGAAWNVHKNNDNVIASRSTIVPVFSYDNSYAAAIVELDDDQAVLVLSIHPKCCGTAGSSEDDTRVFQTQRMIDSINDVRSAPTGSPLHPYRDAPVVVIGDWNLVGSRAPLDLLEDPAGPALSHLVLPQLATDSATTWRELDGFGYPPGMLDLCTHSAHLVPQNHYSIDTANLDAPTLAALSLLADDARASDHLALVADFAFPSEADLSTTGAAQGDPAFGTPDGVVDLTDVLFFVNIWSGDLGTPSPNPDSPADVTTTSTVNGDPGFGEPDGDVNLSDLLYLINIWETDRFGC